MLGKFGKWLIRIVWLIWLFVMLLIGLKIALDNTEQVQVTLFGWAAPASSLGTALCAALLCGVIVGWLASSGPFLLARQRARRLEKQLRHSRHESRDLRASPVKP